MNSTFRSSRRLVAWSAAALIGGLAFAGSAFAATPPTNLTVTSPTDQAAATVTFGDSTPADGTTIVGYEGGLAGGPFAPVVSGGAVATPNVGVFTVQVRAIQSDGAVSDPATAPLIVDRANPTIGVELVGTPSEGWYRQLTFHFTCADDNALPSGQCADVTQTQSGPFAAGRTFGVTDVAGKTASVASGAFNFDAVLPTAAIPVSPGPLVPDQPTFTWRPSTDTLSGVDHYELQWQRDDTDTPGDWNTLKTVTDTGGIGDYSVVPSDYAATPLPENVVLNWRVVTVDNAGNRRNPTNSQTRTLTIDPTVPPAPAITAGPNAPTRDTSPRFTWEGSGSSFRWYVTSSDSVNPIRSGAGTATEAVISALGDGAYVFHVTQYTAANRESAEAIRSFVVDTTPPAAPVILVRPTFPSVTDAIFTWATEPGAYSRWGVNDSAGAPIVPATDTPVTSATLPTLADGTYTFVLQQIDAAGNVSPATIEPFTVIAPLVPPSGNDGTITILPRQNAKRLQPKAGKIVMSRSPVLRWTRGPRGTKLFNLQIFRVTRTKGSATPRVTKILSVFPKGRAYRVPKSKTAPRTCYVWRVWPYTGTQFTPKPLGVSNYCVASKKVLTKKAAIIAARKAAKAGKR